MAIGKTVALNLVWTDESEKRVTAIGEHRGETQVRGGIGRSSRFWEVKARKRKNGGDGQELEKIQKEMKVSWIEGLILLVIQSKVRWLGEPYERGIGSGRKFLMKLHPTADFV